MRRANWLTCGVTAAIAVTALLAAGCGGNDDETSATSSTTTTSVSVNAAPAPIIVDDLNSNPTSPTPLVLVPDEEDTTSETLPPTTSTEPTSSAEDVDADDVVAVDIDDLIDDALSGDYEFPERSDPSSVGAQLLGFLDELDESVNETVGYVLQLGSADTNAQARAMAAEVVDMFDAMLRGTDSFNDALRETCADEIDHDAFDVVRAHELNEIGAALAQMRADFEALYPDNDEPTAATLDDVSGVLDAAFGAPSYFDEDVPDGFYLDDEAEASCALRALSGLSEDDVVRLRDALS